MAHIIDALFSKDRCKTCDNVLKKKNRCDYNDSCVFCQKDCPGHCISCGGGDSTDRNEDGGIYVCGVCGQDTHCGYAYCEEGFICECCKNPTCGECLSIEEDELRKCNNCNKDKKTKKRSAESQEESETKKQKQPWLLDDSIFDTHWKGDDKKDWCIWVRSEDEGEDDAQLVEDGLSEEKAKEMAIDYQCDANQDYGEYVDAAYANDRGILGPCMKVFVTKKSRPCYAIYQRIEFRSELERKKMQELIQEDVIWVKTYLGGYIAGEFGSPIEKIDLPVERNFFAWHDRFKMMEVIDKLKREQSDWDIKHEKQFSRLEFIPQILFYPVPISLDYSNKGSIKDYRFGQSSSSDDDGVNEDDVEENEDSKDDNER